MDYSVFLVNEDPYCLWEANIQEQNEFFLNSVNPEYYKFLYETFKDSPEKQLASVAIRTALFQATETFYALLGAFIQAPNCVYAWISKYRNEQLRDFVKKINKNEYIFTTWNVDSVTWEKISGIIFQHYSKDTEINKNISKLFGNFWERLSIEILLNDNFIDEYNSLKHGLRVRNGGFSFAVAKENEHGKIPHDSKFQSLGSSAYGSTFIKVKDLKYITKQKGDKSIYSERVSLNWSHEQNTELLQLLHMSIFNIISVLKITNKIEENGHYLIPEDTNIFNTVFKPTNEINSLTFKPELNIKEMRYLNKQDLSRMIDDYKKKMHQKCTK